MRGYSYFVLVEPPDTTGAAPSPEEIVARLEAEALAVSAELRRRGMPVIAVVGLADGAVAAARIVAHDSTPPYALALLAPSLPPPAGASGARLPRWDDVLAFPDERSPGILAIQSYCDGPLPQGLGGRHPFRRRLVLLAGVDPWLAYSDGRSCPHEISSRPRVPSLDPLEMAAEWLLTSIHFPE
jgi:hypothetical protein